VLEALYFPIGYLALAAIPLSIYDLREHRLPNFFTYPAIAIAALALLVVGLSGEGARSAMGILGGVLTFWVGYLLAKRDLVGMGDLKLLVSSNAILATYSPVLVLVSLAIATALAAVTSLFLIGLRKMTMRTPVAMGPFLLLGFFATLVLANPLEALS
jgi:leader peptidase (prepilin peptidase)/N-methyltransferase